MQPNRTATDYPAESVFPKFAPRTSTHFFMLSNFACRQRAVGDVLEVNAVLFAVAFSD